MTKKSEETKEDIKSEHVKSDAEGAQIVIKSEAPEGFRELKPGKSVCFGTRIFKSDRIIKVGDEMKRTKLKNRFVPETVIKQFKLPDNIFF